MNTTSRFIITGILIILISIWVGKAEYKNGHIDGVKDGRVEIADSIIKWDTFCSKNDPNTNTLNIWGNPAIGTSTLSQVKFQCPNE